MSRLPNAIGPKPPAFLFLLLAMVLGGCACDSTYPHRLSIKDNAQRLSLKDTPPAPARPKAASKRAAAPPAEPAVASTATSTPAPDCSDIPSCNEALRGLVESRGRAWIIRPPTAQEYLSGVRSLAYRVLRARLTCGELAVGVEELRRAPTVLATPPAGAKREDVTRALTLAAKVLDELRDERETRCKPAGVSPERTAPEGSEAKPSAPAAPGPDNTQPAPGSAQPERKGLQ